MASYVVSIDYPTAPTGGVLSGKNIVAVNYELSVGAQAAVAAQMANYATWNDDETGLEIGGVPVPGGGSNALGSPSNPVTNAAAARPTGLTVVYWSTTTQPTNMATGDVWTDIS